MTAAGSAEGPGARRAGPVLVGPSQRKTGLARRDGEHVVEFCFLDVDASHEGRDRKTFHP